VAIVECVESGAQVLNLSVALAQPAPGGERELKEALDYAMQRGAIVVAAAGNQGMIGSSAITRHPWVIPVVAYDSVSRPMDQSNLGGSIARRGIGAPGEAVVSLGAEGAPIALGGTSVAAPFVTGAVALLKSELSRVGPAEVKLAVLQLSGSRRRGLVPPLLDAWGAYLALSSSWGG
jgi:subtilisin family serine protease